MLFWAVAVAAATTAGGAEACTYALFNEELGPKRTPREIAADEERLRRDGLRQATLAAQRQLADGVDAAAVLAEMLVPNVQATYIERTSCGVAEIDYAGSAEPVYEPLAGTAYAGREKEFYRIVSDWGPGSLSHYCNAEVRQRFAEHLRRQLPPDRLKQSYVFLSARRPGGAIQRLMVFEGKGRRPPVNWFGNAQIAGWARRNPNGRALTAAVAAFWRDTAPLLESPRSPCPVAAEDWRRGQADLVARIEESLKPRN